MPEIYLEQSTTFPWLGSILDFLMNHYLQVGELVLDSGCGLGISSFYLSRRGYRVVGIDLDLQTIKVAAKFRCSGKIDKVSFVVGEATHIPFSDERFDVILCLELLEHINCFNVAIKELASVLKKGGICIISIPISRLMPFSIDWIQRKLTGKITIDEYAKHIHRFDPCGFLKLLEQNGFRIMKTLYYAQYLHAIINFIIAMQRKSGADFFYSRYENRVITRLGYFLRLACMLITKLEINLFKWAKHGSNLVVICQKGFD